MKTRIAARLVLVCYGIAFPFAALAQAPTQDQQDQQLEEAVVTGARVRQGGAQDINFFRGEVDEQRIPHPTTITSEGLMGTHDIQLRSTTPCRQLLCLSAESAPANLLALPQATHLVGLGFETGMDLRNWRRPSLNLVAVVDKSGSMSGQPLELVRRSLLTLTKQMRGDDQLAIVLYGDTAHVYLPPTRLGSQRDDVERAIRRIESAGSTFMEAGLRVGYAVAFESAVKFTGITRLMLFTDEQPNVGAVDDQSFMGMAEQASRRGVGLSTVGVGVQFDAKLATKIGSVRGGNLFFMRNDADIKSLFEGQLDLIVNEIAYDLKLKLTPAAGYRIAGVYGVPGDLLGWQPEGAVEVSVPTVFLSQNGGAIFYSLAPRREDNFLPAPPPSSAMLAQAELSYVTANSQDRAVDRVVVEPSSAAISEGMRKGHLLVDEFTVLHAATSAHHIDNDPEKAWQLMRAYQARLDALSDSSFDDERKLIASLEGQFALLSGHGSESAHVPAYTKLWGRWKIARVNGGIDMRPFEILEFTAGNDFRIYRSIKTEPREAEDYRYNESQVYLDESELTFDYRVRGDRLTLRHKSTGVQIECVRLAQPMRSSDS